MTRRLHVLAVAGATALLALSTLTAPAWAAGGNAIINDCLSNGRLTQHYTPTEIRQALAQIKDADQVTNLRPDDGRDRAADEQCREREVDIGGLMRTREGAGERKQRVAGEEEPDQEAGLGEEDDEHAGESEAGDQ